jgi:cell division protein FtsQ
MTKTRAVPPAAPPHSPRVIRWIVRLLPVALLLIAGVFVLQTIETFLISYPGFSLPMPEEYGGVSPGIRISGVVNASVRKVESVFAEDAGRSLYMFEPRERRLRLLAVDWVRDASVARIWPNRIDVRIVEREPAAYLSFGDGQRSRTALIDLDGVILPKPERAHFDLPVLLGVSPAQPEGNRAARVRLAKRMLADIGPSARDVSEVDVADPAKLAIHFRIGVHPVSLIIGRERFRERLANFLQHYPEIRRRVPAATTFDLRLDDRITAVDGWGGEGGAVQPPAVPVAPPVAQSPAPEEQPTGGADASRSGA